MGMSVPDTSNQAATADNIAAHNIDQWLTNRFNNKADADWLYLCQTWENMWAHDSTVGMMQKMFADWQATPVAYQSPLGGPPKNVNKFVAFVLGAEDIITLLTNEGRTDLFADLPQTVDKSATKYLSFGWDGTGDYLQGTFVPTAPKVFVQPAQG